MKKKQWLWLVLLTPWTGLLAQSLSVKSDLGSNLLTTPVSLIGTNEVTSTSIVKGGQFLPSASVGYTVEWEGKSATDQHASLELRVNSADAKGGFYSIFPQRIEDYNKAQLAAFLDNQLSFHTYRIAVQGLNVYYYRDGILLSKGTLGQVLTASVQETLGDNVLNYGTFENCTTGAAPSPDWGTIPAGRIGSGSYSRVAADGWAVNGSKFMFLRMRDNDALSSEVIYTKLSGLIGGQTYQVALNYKGHSSFLGTINVKTMLDYTNYNNDSYLLGKTATMEAETTGTSGTTSTTKALVSTFSLPIGRTECYLVFVKNGNSNMYIDDLTIKPISTSSDIEPEIAVAVDPLNNGASATIQTALVKSVKYDLTGAYAPVSPNAGCLSDANNLLSDPGFDLGMNGVDGGFVSQNTLYTGTGEAGITSTEPYCGQNMGFAKKGGVITTTLTNLKTFNKYTLRAAIKGDKAELMARSSSLSESIYGTDAWKESTLNFTTGGNSTVTLSFSAADADAYTDNWVLTDAGAAESVTEGTINTSFVSENEMMSSLLQMLADHMTYAKSIYTTAGTNSVGEPLGYFKASSAGQNNEDGVRTNTDYAFICAFLYTHGKNVSLPSGITMADIKDMAIKALTWAYSTHRANQLKLCTNNAYWGSSMKTSVYTWESSMWAESAAYATWLLGDELNATQKAYTKAMIMDEANYEVSRDIPSGYTDDTKAEENGWDTNILACAAAMYPDEPNADAWYNKMRQFAMNSYSINQDKYDYSLADGKRVRDWYIGTNLWDDYTLQNHAFFHTSYQNIAIQELSESFMALKAMQEGKTAKRTFPLSETLKHNIEPMWNNVLKELALADGELAMPNGNDWSMFLYDQLASYTAMATIYRDPDALMLENMAFKYTRARQQTTSDGSWMLNSDIGPRRMGVTGRRIVMTYLYHKYFPTASLTPSSWADFSSLHETTKYFPYVNVIRSQTSDRFTAFSWAASKASYTGMIGTSSPDKNKIFIPYRNSNTGNFTGIFKQGSAVLGATPVISGYYGMYPKSYHMNGNLTMGSLLNQRFVLYSTSGNAVIYLYNLDGAASGTLNMEGGAAMAVSTDPFTKETRTLYYEGGNLQSNGNTLNSIASNWVNIDNEVGVVAKNDDLKMAFGSRSLVNSIYTSILYPCYSEAAQTYTTSTRKERNAVYYSNVNAETTAKLASQLQVLKLGLGWNGVIAADPNGTNYLIAANFTGSLRSATPITVTCPLGAPVFNKETVIAKDSATATFYCVQNYSVANELKVFVRGAALTGVQENENSEAAYLQNNADVAQTAQVSIVAGGKIISGEVAIESGKTVYVSVKNDLLQVTEVVQFPGSYRNVALGTHAYAYSQMPGNLPFNVIDEDKDTYYQSVTNPSTGNEYLTFRLRNSYTIDKIIITPRAGYAPKDVTIQTSLTDTYSGIATTATLQDSSDAQEISFDARTARFVRIKINNGYGNQVGIYDVKIMGTPNAAN